MKKAVTRCMVILMLLLTVVGVKRPEKIYAAGVSEAVTLKKDGSWVTQQVPEQTSENFWYKVEIPSVGNLNIKVENALERGLKWNLYTEDLGKVASNSYYYLAGGETGRKTYALSPGRYYLNVYVDNREKSGKFKVSAAFAAFKGLEDQKAVSFVSPQVYTVGKTVRGAITHTEKEDWYRFSVSEEGEYTVNVVTENIDVIDMIGGRPFEVNLNDSSNVRMSYSNYWPGDTLKITRKLTPGTYYINIKKYDACGQYSMTVRTPIKLTTPTKPENPQVTEPKALGKVVLQKKYGSSKNSLKLSWQPVYGADGYEMRYATSKSLTKNVRIKNFVNCNNKLHTFAPHHTCGVMS